MWKILFLFLFCVPTFGRIIIVEPDNKTLSNHPIKDVTNLNGLSLRIAYFELGPTLHRGNIKHKISGVYGDSWTLLGEFLNFTLVTKRLDRNKFPGVNEFAILKGFLVEQETDVMAVVHDAIDKRVDYLLQFFTNKQQIYVRPLLKTNEKWLFTLVDYQIWFVLGAFLVLMAIVGWIADHFLVPKILRFSMGDQLFYNFSNLCIQDTQPNNFKNRFHVLTIVRCVLVFMFWGYFSTFLYAQLTVKIQVETFRNAQELLEKTDVKVLAVARYFRNGPLRWTLDDPVYKKRIELVSGDEILFEKICLTDKGKYAMVTLDYLVERLRLECEVRKAGEVVSNNNIYGAVRKDFQYKRSLDIGVLKLKESGLLKRVRNHWFPPVPKENSNSEVEPFGLSHFKYVFVIWGLGIILCLVLFVGEVIVWNLQEKRKENIQLYPFVL